MKEIEIQFKLSSGLESSINSPIVSMLYFKLYQIGYNELHLDLSDQLYLKLKR